MKKIIVCIDLISAVLLLLFLYTAFSKLMQYAEFRLALASSSLLKPFSGTLVWLLPLTEIAVALLLFFPSTRLTGLQASLFLLLVFTAYLSFMILLKQDLPCSCGGVLKSLNWPEHICFNLFFAALAATGILLYKKHQKAMQNVPP